MQKDPRLLNLVAYVNGAKVETAALFEDPQDEQRLLEAAGRIARRHGGTVSVEVYDNGQTIRTLDIATEKDR